MDVFSLVARLTLDSSEYDKALGNAEGKFSSVGSALKSGFGTIAKVGTAALTAAASAVGVLGKKAIEGYADFEQLEGGVKKLFGEDAAKTIIDNANKAFSTAGVSANQYMEQATSFSAALINSLDGDTAKAAELTDVAMRAISDNFNTFGSDIGSIQNAFQGFAKQNYTMLDNLKLGYGGTKAEMERLISDANEYAESIGEAADLSIDSFSDIVQAIELVQQKQGVAGTTAKEATTTISGALGMLKASWENLLNGFANDNADLGSLIDNVVNSAVTAFDRLLPAAEKAFSGIGSAIEKIVPLIGEKLPGLINQLLPALLNSATSLVNALVKSLPTILRLLVENIPTVIKSIVDAIQQTIPQFVILGKEMFGNLLEGISSNGPSMVKSAMEMMLKFSGTLREKAGELVDAGLQMIKTIAQSLIENIPVFIQTIPTIISNIAGIINDNAPKLLATGIELIGQLIKGIIQAIPTLIAEFPKIIKAIADVITAFNWLNLGKNIIEFIGNGVKSLATNIPNALKGIGKNAIEFFKNLDWKNLGSTLINFIVNGIKSLLTAIPNALKSIGQSAWTAFKNINWLDLGKNIIMGIISGVTSKVKDLVDSVKNAAKAALDGAKNLLGINSPSKEFAWIGRMVDEGFAQGITQNEDKVSSAIKGLNTDVTSGINVTPTTTASTTTSGGGNLGRIETLLSEILQNLGQGVYLDTGVLVGATAGAMNSTLGTINVRSGRR